MKSRMNRILVVLSWAASALLAASGAARAATVGYWQLDDGIVGSPGLADVPGTNNGLRLTASVGPNLTLPVGGIIASDQEAVGVVHRPDTTPGFVGNATDNFGSLWSPGGVSNLYLTASNATLFTLDGKAWTFEGWFRHDSGTAPEGFGDIIGGSRDSRDGFSTYLTTAWKLRAGFYEYQGTNFLVESPSPVSSNAWHHFAVTWQDGAGANGTGYAELFLDGTLVASNSAPAGFDAATTDNEDADGLRIAGRQSNTAENNWHGQLDEFRFSDQILTPAQFLYNADYTFKAYWQLDESSGDALDAIGSYDLNRNGGAQTTDRGPDPVWNPDAGPFDTGAPKTNLYAVSAPLLRRSVVDGSPFQMNNASSFTLEGWMKVTNTATGTGLRGVLAGDRQSINSPIHNGWFVNLNYNGHLFFTAEARDQATNSTASADRVDDNRWRHFAAVWDHDADGNPAVPGVEGELRLFIDGKLNSSTNGFVQRAYASTLAVGERHSGGTWGNSPWPGILDEIRFWNRALAPAEFLNVRPPGTVVAFQ